MVAVQRLAAGAPEGLEESTLDDIVEPTSVGISYCLTWFLNTILRFSFLSIKSFQSKAQRRRTVILII